MAFYRLVASDSCTGRSHGGTVPSVKRGYLLRIPSWSIHILGRSLKSGKACAGLSMHLSRGS